MNTRDFYVCIPCIFYKWNLAWIVTFYSIRIRKLKIRAKIKFHWFPFFRHIRFSVCYLWGMKFSCQCFIVWFLSFFWLFRDVCVVLGVFFVCLFFNESANLNGCANIYISLELRLLYFLIAIWGFTSLSISKNFQSDKIYVQ